MDRHAVRFGVDLAVGQSPAALWEFDVSRARLSWEPPAARLLGVDAGAVPGGPVELAAAVHPQDATAVLAAFRDLVEAGWAEVELRVGQDADLRHLSLRGRVLDRDPDG
ncbi:MAG TPA: PAS domain-containing protein, partial [Catenuloplanes sp.]